MNATYLARGDAGRETAELQWLDATPVLRDGGAALLSMRIAATLDTLKYVTVFMECSTPALFFVQELGDIRAISAEGSNVYGGGRYRTRTYDLVRVKHAL